MLSTLCHASLCRTRNRRKTYQWMPLYKIQMFMYYMSKMWKEPLELDGYIQSLRLHHGSDLGLAYL